MSVSAISSSAATYAAAYAAPAPAPVKDSDGDYDNGAPSAKAATPPGVGEKLDITA